MRDEQERLAQVHLKVLQLRPQRLAQLGVQRRQRLVHQEHLGRAHDGPPDRDALHLAARQPVGLAVQQMLDPQGLRHPRDAFGAISASDTDRIGDFSGNSRFCRTV